MDNKKVAKELIRLAKDIIVAYKANVKRSILNFVKDNKEALKEDEYALIRIKVTGPKQDTKWMNIDIEDLEKMVKGL